MIVLSAITGGCFYLAEGKKFEKHLKYLGTLVMIIALISPLPRLFSEGFSEFLSVNGVNLQISDETYAQALKKEAEKRLDEDFSSLIANKCELPKDTFTVHTVLTYENKQFDIGTVEIKLHTLAAVTKREEIRKIITEYTQNIVFVEEFQF